MIRFLARIEKTLVQIEVAILHSVAIVVKAGGARFGPFPKCSTNQQVRVDASFHQSMVAHFYLHAGIAFISPRFHQILVQSLKIAKVFVGVVLSAGYSFAHGIAGFLVEVTFAVHALDAVHC